MADLSPPARTRDGLACLAQTDDHIRLLIDWLGTQLPHSDKVFHTLRCALTPYRPHLHLSIYADSLSHDTLTTVLIIYGQGNASTAIVQAQQPNTTPQLAASLPIHQPTSSTPSTPPDVYNISFHTTHPPTATALLQHTVDLTRPLEFAGIHRHHRQLVHALQRWYEAAHREEEVELEYDACNHYDYPFLVAPASLAGAPPTAASGAVRFARLPATLETGALIASHWPYSSVGTAALIRNLLAAAESDSYGAYRGDQLVAWEVKQAYGAIGKHSHTHTLAVTPCQCQCGACRCAFRCRLIIFVPSAMSGLAPRNAACAEQRAA